MPSSMVSIRMPSSLVQEFKQLSKKDHYLDLSEAARSIVRKRWIETTDPMSFQIKNLRKDITKSISSKTKQQLMKELEKIKESIEHE